MKVIDFRGKICEPLTFLFETMLTFEDSNPYYLVYFIMKPFIILNCYKDKTLKAYKFLFFYFN